MAFYEFNLAYQLTSIDIVPYVLGKENCSGIVFHLLSSNL
jgi:hypothetical protein